MDSNNIIGKLQNGIRYIYSHNSNISTISVLITVRYGSAFDKKAGIAHLLEHILFKGTKKRPQTKEIMAELNSIGSEYNAYTSKSFTGYHAKAAYIHLEHCVDILSDLVANTNFYTKTFSHEFVQEKKIVVEELKAVQDNKMRYILEVLDKNIFTGEMADNVTDDIAEIDSITLDDIIAVYKKYYVGSNMIVSINGNLDKHKSTIPKLLEQYLGHISMGTPNKFIFDSSYFSKTPKRKTTIIDKAVIKAVVAVAFPNGGYKSRTKYYMLELFRLVFCDLTSGRLFQEIREKRGLVYSIKSVNFCYDNLGYFCIQTNTNVKNIDELLKELKYQLELAKEKGISKKELELAKSNYSGNMLLELENSMTIADYNAYELFYHNKSYTSYGEILKLINDISLDEINKFIRELLSQKSILTLIHS
jgi:predicted Zn-dependent peptidase